MDLATIGQRDDLYVWIYGAGQRGRKLYQGLQNRAVHLAVMGFAVSDMAGNAEVIEGIRVCSLDQIDTPREKTCFLIAAAKAYAEEIAEFLHDKGWYHYLIIEEEQERRLYLLARHSFADRRGQSDKVLYILAGYKEFLWEDVFQRIKTFLPEDIEVCILSSGLYHPKLAGLAEENGWSYLYTEYNSISLIQNIFMYLFRDKTWFYKMDEDIFLTEGIFEKLMSAYGRAKESEPYLIGFVAPLIPVNGYGYIRILDKLDLRSKYEKKFDKVLYGGHSEKMLEANVEAAEFMWGATGDVPQLDELNRLFGSDESYSFCNVRFSIGCILFRRDFWDEIGCFDMGNGRDLGIDEITICETCIIKSRVILVAENAVVGHFSFGVQTEGMKKVYKEQHELFEIRQQEKGEDFHTVV